MADLDTVELSNMLSHFSQRRALEIEIKCEGDDLRVIVALEKMKRSDAISTETLEEQSSER
jgi:hypothetical protein